VTRETQKKAVAEQGADAAFKELARLGGRLRNRENGAPSQVLAHIQNWPTNALFDQSNHNELTPMWRDWIWALSLATKRTGPVIELIQEAIAQSPAFVAAWASALPWTGLGLANHSDTWGMDKLALAALPKQTQDAVLRESLRRAARAWDTDTNWECFPEFGAQLSDAERREMAWNWAWLDTPEGGLRLVDERESAQEALDVAEDGLVALERLERWLLVNPKDYPDLLGAVLANEGDLRETWGNSATSARSGALLARMAERAARDPRCLEWKALMERHAKKALHPESWAMPLKFIRAAAEARDIQGAVMNGQKSIPRDKSAARGDERKETQGEDREIAGSPNPRGGARRL